MKTPVLESLFHEVFVPVMIMNTTRKVSKYGVISGPYFPVFSPNTGKYGPEIPPYLDTFHAVEVGNNSDPSSREDQEN